MADCAPPLADINRPLRSLPPDACDSHCHIFGPAALFPFSKNRPYTPPDAPFEALRVLHRKLGISRAVIVQAGCHGFDLSAVLDALAKGAGQYRGVALLAPDTTPDRIRFLDEQGFRAVRFNFLSHLRTTPWADIQTIARLVAPFGWHVCIHTDQKSLSDLLPLLEQLPLPIVIDHMGRVCAGDGLGGAGFKALSGLAREPDVWVKISGIDRISTTGKRPFSDGKPLVRALIDSMADRLLWGTDWPHPNVRGEMPDDGELVDIFTELCPDPAVQHRILVTNPQTLYRFDVTHAAVQADSGKNAS